MYVVLINYIAPLEEMDSALPDHVQWLTKNYENNHFLASGRQNPRVGGVILARAMDRDKLDAILAEDPFSVRQLARYEVVDFVPTTTAPELQSLKEAP